MQYWKQHFHLTPDNPPNNGILFVNHKATGRTGHMGHALVEYAPGEILAFYPNCSAEDDRWKGHSGFGWMEYRRSRDGGITWSAPIIEAHTKALFDEQSGRTMMCEKAVRAPNGNIILFYLTCDMVTNGHIWEPYFEPKYAISTNQGQSFGRLMVFSDEPGRIYDALVHNGKIYILFFANKEEPGCAHTLNKPYRLYVSEDSGKSFQHICDVPFPTTKHCYYGTMEFLKNERLIVYIYDEFDEYNLKYLISNDGGKTWNILHRAFFKKGIRNPQLIHFDCLFFMHGRSSRDGTNGGSFVLYSSKDGIHWDEGCYLQMRTAGVGAYSNNLCVHCLDGRNRLLIQSSHAYHENRTNIMHWWLDHNVMK